MALTDKKYLTDLAREVRRNIKEQNLAVPFSMAKRVRVYEVNSGGWAAQLGIFRGYQCSIDVWFDQFTAHQKRKIYYCIYSNRSEGIKRLIDLAKPHLGSHIPIYLSDWSDEADIVQLSKPLGRKEFGKPVYERYPKNKEYLYGIYEFEKLGLKRNETKRLIERIVEFIVTINEALSKEKIRQDAETYRSVENRKAVQRHLQRERKGHLVLLRKQLDNYICQICDFDFRKKYGSLGDDFAEAHHVRPLGKDGKQRTTTVDDLITVCPNFHRMLHRMQGEAGDISKLKAIIRKTKAKRSN